MAKFDSTGAQTMADRHSAPFTNYVPVTPAATPLADGACRAILASEDGVLDLTPPGGEAAVVNVTVLKGINPFAADVIDEPTTGTAPTSVMALY